MAKSVSRKGAAETLRKRAEEEINLHSPRESKVLSPESAAEAIHELRVHQIELEMQNEELLRAQQELEDSRQRYFDLYDMAPVGYITLSRHGLILEANLTAARLLAVKRGSLVQKPLAHFVLFEDEDLYREHRERLFETEAMQVFELRLVKRDGGQFWARLEATAAVDADGTPVCRATISNIAERKHGEEALQQAYNETEQKVHLRTRELQDSLAALQRANRALLVLKECEGAVARSNDELELLEKICRIAVKIDGMKMAWVGFAEHDESKAVHPVVFAGADAADMNEARITWANEPRGRGPTGTAIRTRRVVVCQDITKERRITPWRAKQLQLGYAAVIALPLVWMDQCLGALSIFSGQPNAFDDRTVDLLTRLTGDLAFGIIALRTRVERELLQRELLTISEREKQLIAQDLHDGLCQHLVGTSMMGSLLANRLAEKGDPDAAQASEICKLLNMGAEEARNISHGLHPVRPEEEGLMEALLLYAATTTKLFPVDCSFRCCHSVEIKSQVVATHFFRIAQEAVNNAMKHGQATRVVITLSLDRSVLKLSIRDNGIGIPSDSPPPKGMGMQIMNYRASSIGATLKIGHAARGGTVVNCMLSAV